MKKDFFTKLVFFIVSSCIFVSGCSFSGDDDNTALKAAVILAANNSNSSEKVRVNLNFDTPRGGTLLPSQELTDLTFDANKVEGSGHKTVTAPTKEQLCSKEIWLQTGTWDFTLSGFIDGVEFKGELKNFELAKNNASLSFNLTPDGISDGALHLVLNFSGDADYAELKVTDTETNASAASKTYRFNAETGSNEKKKIEYSKTFKGQNSEGLTPGTYLITVDFYRDGMKTGDLPLNTWKAYARIKAGLTAATEVEDFDLTDSYTITYHNVDNTALATSGVAVACFSRKSGTITLPVYTNAAGFNVLCWYETENFDISTLGITEFESKNNLRNMNFYPLWDTDTAHVANGGTGNGLTAANPASSVTAALTTLQKLHAYGSAQTDLTVQVSGEVTGNTTIGTSLDSFVDSLTLCGKDGNETDSLKGSGSGSVLKVQTSKPVTVKKLKITGGSGATCGGGIYIDGTSSVILEDGALIEGNEANQKGGGIYVSQNTGTAGRTSLTINAGAKISGNKIKEDETYGNNGGMAIYVYGAKVEMNGGEISQNNGQTINQRGAVRLNENAVLDLNDGKITNNSAYHIAGNIFCRASTINMKGGEISSGKASTKYSGGGGGGLWIEGASSFNMTGGVFLKNTAEKGSGGAVYIDGRNSEGVGPVFSISGTAYIPSATKQSKDNDIYYQKNYDGNTYPAIEISGALTPNASDVQKGAIALSPRDWKRRQVVLKAAATAPSGLNIEDYEAYFCFTSSGSFLSYGDNTAIIMAPYYVSDADNASDEETVSGDSENPYKTLNYAVGKLSGGYDEIIYINGTIKSASEIPDEFTTTKCKSLTIIGANGLDAQGNPKDVLTLADDAESGSVLTINTQVPVTLKNIKITGGKGTLGSSIYTTGGGIDVGSNATLKLADGVLITGNTATLSGGGIYLGNNSDLYMYGSSYVGDKQTRLAVHDSSTQIYDFANAAGNGGGIYNSGNVYLGYSGKDSSGNLIPADWTGGICRNCAGKGGGIVSSSSSTVKMRTGKISYNSAKYSKSGYMAYDKFGGGIYSYAMASSTNNVEISGGEISHNAAENGGGIFTDSGAVLKFTGGKMEANSADENGGAINYTNGKIEVSGSVYIPCAGEKQNDVYLAESKFITIAGNLSLPDGVSPTETNVTLAPASWKRGLQVLNGAVTDDIAALFATTDPDFGVSKATATSGIIEADIVVATNNSSSYNASTARGTYSDPYKTIHDAIVNAVDSDHTTVTVKGTVTGAQIVTGMRDGVDTVTVRGKDSTATIDAGSSGSAIEMRSTKNLIIQNLKITGGSASQGGGINITAAATVNLDSGAIVTNNKATNGGKGAGVYVLSGATLNVKTGSEISSNSAVSGSISGGGVYNDGTVSMTGGTISSNTATTGGAIYNANTLTLNGTLSIPAGTGAGANDIAVYYDSSAAAPAMKMVSAGASLSATASSIAITPTSWIRGKQVLAGTASNFSCFKMSDSDWSIIQTSVSSTHAGKIDAPIYVCATGNETKGSSAATGYKTLAAAVAQCWMGPSDTNSTNGRIIYISGTVTGAQSIPSSITTTANATKLTLQGTGTSPQLKGGFTSESKGTTLTVSTAVPVVVKSLTITGGYAASNGGGIDIEAGSVDLASGAVVSGNTATANGGGVYVKSGATLTVSAGTVQSNTAASGGAIYNAGTLNLTGSVSIPKGTGANNIALYYDTSLTTPDLKPVTVTSGFSTSSNILLTPTGYKRGKTAVSGATATQAGKFELADTEWSILTDTGYIGKIDAPIYVAQAAACEVDSVSYGVGKSPADGGLGTKAAPYDTIANAVSQCWNGPNDNVTEGTGSNAVTVGRVINVVGTLEGSQTIGSVITTSAHASTLTIKGVDSNATFHGKGSSSSMSIGKPLSIESAVPVVLQNLILMNGYHRTKNGGGIYVKAAGAKLTLGENVQVKNNTLEMTSGGSLGGGVYIEGTSTAPATLIMKSNADISNNNAKQYQSSSTKGGGVYLKYANLCMSGTARIGLQNSTEPTTSSKTNHALYGGGVYADTGSTVWLGYSEPDDSKTSDLSDGYGIRWNFGFKAGGGIYNNGGTIKMASGVVSYNATSNKASDSTQSDLYSGGGVYNAGTLSLSGGKITGNKSDQGGGVYNDGSGAKIYMTGTALIGGSADVDATDATGNFAARKGGGVYNNGGYIYLGYASSNNNGTPASASATELTGGIRQNYACYKTSSSPNVNAAWGGGVYSSDGKIYYNTGNVSYNGAGNGGGFYLDYSTSGANLVMTGGTMASNKAGVGQTGGVVAGYGGSVYVNSNGGASAATIKSSFALSGTETSIASTANKNNDIYLRYDCSVTVAGSLGSSFATRINSIKNDDGTLVLSPQSSSDTDVAYVLNNFKKFTHHTRYIQSNGVLFSNQSAQNITANASSGTFGVVSQADLLLVNMALLASTNGLSGVTLKLADDVELNSSWTGLGSSSNPFKGNLNGNYKTVKFTSAKYGLINYASGSTVQKLKTTGTISATSSSAPLGSVVGTIKTSGTVQLCANYATVTCTQTGGYASVGGIVGSCDNSSGSVTDIIIDCCKNWGAVSHDIGNYGVGGIAGEVNGGTVMNCENFGAVTNNASSYGLAGGIVGEGYINGSRTNIYNCANNGNVTSSAKAGGILGGRGRSAFKNCWVNCRVTSSSGQGGGLSGENGHTIANCYVRTGDNLASEIYPGEISVTGCTMTNGSVSTFMTSLNTQATTNSWKQWHTYTGYLTIDSSDSTWNDWMKDS